MVEESSADSYEKEMPGVSNSDFTSEPSDFITEISQSDTSIKSDDLTMFINQNRTKLNELLTCLLEVLQEAKENDLKTKHVQLKTRSRFKKAVYKPHRLSRSTDTSISELSPREPVKPRRLNDSTSSPSSLSSDKLDISSESTTESFWSREKDADSDSEERSYQTLNQITRKINSLTRKMRNRKL
jgi:hypothetical protein